MPATLPPAPLGCGLQLTYEAGATQLADEQRKRLDAEVARKSPSCATWPSNSSAVISYVVAAETLPRKDYQFVGERVEQLRSYLMARHRFAEVRFEIWLGAPRRVMPRMAADVDYVAIVMSNCER